MQINQPETQSYIRVIIQWPSGTVLPVFIKCLDTVGDLIRMLDMCTPKKDEIQLFFRGFLLSPELTIAANAIRKNDVIKVGFVCKPIKQKPRKNSSGRSGRSYIKELYRESLRIDDLKFKVLEGNSLCSLAFQEMYKSIKDYPDYSEDEEITIIAEQPKAISNSPLPNPYNIEFTEELNEEPTFGEKSISQIHNSSDFLRKNKREERWSW